MRWSKYCSVKKAHIPLKERVETENWRVTSREGNGVRRGVAHAKREKVRGVDWKVTRGTTRASLSARKADIFEERKRNLEFWWQTKKWLLCVANELWPYSDSGRQKGYVISNSNQIYVQSFYLGPFIKLDQL